jgi:hypothetical protein
VLRYRFRFDTFKMYVQSCTGDGLVVLYMRLLLCSLLVGSICSTSNERVVQEKELSLGQEEDEEKGKKRKLPIYFACDKIIIEST